MKCPLMIMAQYKTRVSGFPEDFNCLEEECAEWVETQNRCAIKDIALSLGFMSMDMTQILEKMPHADQFKK